MSRKRKQTFIVLSSDDDEPPPQQQSKRSAKVQLMHCVPLLYLVESYASAKDYKACGIYVLEYKLVQAVPERKGQLQLCLSQAAQDCPSQPLQSSQSPGAQRRQGLLPLQSSQSPANAAPTPLRPPPAWPLSLPVRRSAPAVHRGAGLCLLHKPQPVALPGFTPRLRVAVLFLWLS